MGDHSGVLMLVKGVFALGAILAVLIFVVRPMVRILTAQPNLDALMPSFETPAEEELQIPSDGKAPKANRDQMLKDLRTDPRRTALLVQQLLREKSQGQPGAPAREGSGPERQGAGKPASGKKSKE